MPGFFLVEVLLTVFRDNEVKFFGWWTQNVVRNLLRDVAIVAHVNQPTNLACLSIMINREFVRSWRLATDGTDAALP